MKKSIAFVLSLGVVVYWSGASIYAQGKGVGHSSAPSVNQGHSQGGTRNETKTSSNQHGSEHSNGHAATKATWETKLNGRVESDPAFRSRIESLLPAGMDLKTAESGFKNHGQFIAALHVSKNLNISFEELKARMTGVPTTATTSTTSSTSTGQTSSTPMSLGKAIQELRPSLTQNQASEEAKKAEKQATLTQKTGPTS